MGPRRAQALHQRYEMREAAELAVALRGSSEIEMREGICRRAVSGNSVLLEKRFADEVRRSPVTETDAGLPEINREQLAVGVREVQQRNVAERRHVVELVGGLGRACAGSQACTRGGRERKQLEEFAPLQLPVHRGSRIEQQRDEILDLLWGERPRVAEPRHLRAQAIGLGDR